MDGWMDGWRNFHDSLIMKNTDSKASDSLL